MVVSWGECIFVSGGDVGCFVQVVKVMGMANVVICVWLWWVESCEGWCSSLL